MFLIKCIEMHVYVFDKLYSLLNVIKNKNAHEPNYILI